jgi:hypothetical protein
VLLDTSIASYQGLSIIFLSILVKISRCLRED